MVESRRSSTAARSKRVFTHSQESFAPVPIERPDRRASSRASRSDRSLSRSYSSRVGTVGLVLALTTAVGVGDGARLALPLFALFEFTPPSQADNDVARTAAVIRPVILLLILKKPPCDRQTKTKFGKHTVTRGSSLGIARLEPQRVCTVKYKSPAVDHGHHFTEPSFEVSISAVSWTSPKRNPLMLSKRNVCASGLVRSRP